MTFQTEEEEPTEYTKVEAINGVGCWVNSEELNIAKIIGK